MMKIIISGCNGHMGRILVELCSADPEIEVVAGFDILDGGSHNFPVYSVPSTCKIPADAVIDFSSPSALTSLLDYCVHNKLPLVLATTGYSQEQKNEIETVSHSIPVFCSSNMSLGINVLLDLVKKAASSLGPDYDIEIIEQHHNHKVDSPSGTALMIANAAASALPYQPEYVYDRHTDNRARGKYEIGISSIRGGTIVGDHTVIFAGHDEVFEIHHHAASREIFANGAIRAAKFLVSVTEPGLYDMSKLIGQ